MRILQRLALKPSNSRYRPQSNEGILLSHLNFKTLGDRAFVAAAPKLWNDLPLEIRMAKSVDTFKKFLKKHLLVNLLFILSLQFHRLVLPEIRESKNLALAEASGQK